MKGLSIEQKAKRYDEALERVKELLSRCRDNRDRRTMVYRVNDIESIFPELKESEDERVRKELIAFLKENYETGRADETWDLNGIERWIAWLEKQVSQKPTEWSEDDEHRVKDTIYFLNTAKKHYASTVELDACIDWLKSLEDRVQPKQEWSAEDNSVLKDIKVAVASYWDEDTENIILDWLKSLRPHKQWKPSEEQMDALETAVSSLQSNTLETLYQDLKRKMNYE